MLFVAKFGNDTQDNTEKETEIVYQQKIKIQKGLKILKMGIRGNTEIAQQIYGFVISEEKILINTMKVIIYCDFHELLVMKVSIMKLCGICMRIFRYQNLCRFMWKNFRYDIVKNMNIVKKR